MPAWGRRQSYSIVVGTTVFTVAVFAVTALLRGAIPDPDPNPVTARRGEFMSLATKQTVHWRTLEDRPFTEARRTDKLVFLYVGCTWSWSARLIDKNVLVEPELAERLNREFIPVRIDASVRPEWEAGPFPLMAAATHADPGWYILVTRPDGTPLAWLARANSESRIDLQTLQNVLSAAERQSEIVDTGGNNPLDQQQMSESAFLNGRTRTESGDLGYYAVQVAQRAAERNAFQAQGVSTLKPWEWRFLLSAGLTPEASTGLEALVKSSFMDWLYGGVYHTVLTGRQTLPKFDKLASENAEMAAVFALWWSKAHQPLARQMAESLFDATLEHFVTPSDVFAYSWLDGGDLGREAHTSVRPKVMRSAFSPDEQKWAVQKLGLDPKTNPALVPHITDLADYDENPTRYERVFAEIRQSLGARKNNLGGRDLADNVATITARLCETARLLGDASRTEKALALATRVWDYRVGPDGVAQALKPTPDAIAYLGDYLAVCDASLQVFLCSGDASVLESGARILKRAKDIFGSGSDGSIRTIPPEREIKEVPWVAMPNVVDGSKGSLVGHYVRIGTAYSLLFRDQEFGKEIHASVTEIVARYASLTKKLPFQIGCLALGLVDATNDTALFVSGPNAKETATRLAKSMSGLMIAPLTGGLRKDLQSRGAGVWICQRDVVHGPLTESQAKAALRSPP